MKLTFCGAAGTTTGSKHLLEVNGQRILLDCGLYQGRRSESIERNKHFPFDPQAVDVVVLSHAHIDHCGALPHLCRLGFQGNIYATPATRDLCSIMLPDAAHIHVSDILWLNKHREEGQPELEPNYTVVDAERCMRQFVTASYHRPQIIADGVRLTFIDAGHVLGSAQVVLDIEERATQRKMRLLFSGDIGRPGGDLLQDAEACERVDHVIMESTYGGRRHELATEADEHLARIIRQTAQQRGRLIIPAFAVERTQQLLCVLDRMRHHGQIAPIPTFVDSPLAVRATEIFRLHIDDLRPELRDAVFMREDPFGFEGLRLVRTVDESKKLNRLKGAAIIISASGMAESGRILHHLRNHVGGKKNTILFVGYCAENTLGWKLREGHRHVRILGEDFPVHAHIEKLDSFSGHADHDELMAWFSRIQGPKKNVFLVHGEPSRTAALQAALQNEYPQSQITAAVFKQSVEL
jgi:metallo-beta-lactamase family protein